MVKKKTQEEFKKDVYDLVGNEYEVLGTYTRSKDNILLRHTKCGNEWDVKVNNFMNGNRCKFCREKSKIKTQKEFSEDIQQKYEGLLILESKYERADKKVTLRCIKHNVSFESTPTNALRENRKNLCPECNRERAKTSQRKKIEEVRKELFEKHKGDIDIVGEYINTHTKTLFKCNTCEETFSSEPNSVLRISGCPICKVSKGEREIARHLDDRGIKYVTQKRFEDCMHKRQLPFDFYLEDFNILIEYDGLQHTEPIEYFGGQKALQELIKRDNIKNRYAEEKGITLIRIPYYYTIQEIHRIIEEQLSQGSKAESLEPKI